MGEHLVLSADHVIKPKSEDASTSSSEGLYNHSTDISSCTININEDEEHDEAGEDKPLIQMEECRICQDEDSVNNLESPCACSGSLKFAHRKCVQRWCNEKGDTICEICNQPYQPAYTAPPRSEETTINIMSGWRIAGTPMDLQDPRLLAMVAAERHILESEYDEYEDSNASGTAFFRSAALILMALLLLRHALAMGDGDDGNDASTFFILFLLRAAGFLLPCYIMAWAITVLQRRRQRHDAETLSSNDVAFMLQAGQHTGLQVTVAPEPAASTVGPVAIEPHVS